MLQVSHSSLGETLTHLGSFYLSGGQIRGFMEQGELLLLLLLSHFSHVWLCETPETAAHQAPLSLGFSRQEHWSGLPFPSPVHESEMWKRSRSVMSNSSRHHRLQSTRLLRPWDFRGKSTGVGCHCLLWRKASAITHLNPGPLHLYTGWEEFSVWDQKFVLPVKP